MNPKWYETSYRRMLIDFHFPDWDDSILSRYDAQKHAELIAATGVDGVTFYAKDHYGNAYYDTRVGKKHGSIGSRDIFGEFVAAARQHEMPVLGYYSLVWDQHIAQTHPEWVMVDIQGTKRRDELYWSYVCVNNDGYADYVSAQLQEIVTGYDIDGFWLDMLIFDTLNVTCYCQGCREKFRNQTGEDLPKQADWSPAWQRFIQFRYETVLNFQARLIKEIKAVKPEVSVVFNYQAGPGFSWKTGQKPVAHSIQSDYGTAETYPPAFGYRYTGMVCRFLRAIKAERPYEALSCLFSRLWDYTCKPQVQLTWETMAALSYGAKMSFVDQPSHDGTLNPVAYQQLAAAYREAGEKEACWGGSPLKEVGLYYSVKTRDLYGKNNDELFSLPFHGAYKALTENHVQTDILLDENVTLEGCLQYPVIILPNVAVLSDEELDMVLAYVESGGHLIASYETSRFDTAGNERSDFALADLFGASYVDKTSTETNYFSMDDESLSKDIDPRGRFLNWGPGNVVSATGREIGKLYNSYYDRRPHHFFSHNLHPPAEAAGPALVENRVGKGRVVYSAFRLFGGYAWDYYVPEAGTLIANLIGALGRPLPIRVAASKNVEVVMTEQPEQQRYIVHLLGCFPAIEMKTVTRESSWGTHTVSPFGLIEENPVYEVAITTSWDSPDISVVNSDTECSLENATAKLVVRRPHEAVIIKKPAV